MAEPERVVRHRHFRTAGLRTGPSAVLDRVPLLWNADVAISMARPQKEDAFLYRNGQGDEVAFVVEGEGVLESPFGDLDYRPGDYVVIPRGVLHRWRLGPSPARLLVIESAGPVRTPKRYRNEHGQLTEMAPFSERDVRRPERLVTHDETGEFKVVVKSGNRLVEMLVPHHPFDVVGWDGYYYPWAFSIHDFEPRVGRVHLPPPVHQTFEGEGFVICSFCPRPYDFEPEAVSAPYSHQNVMSDEVLFYANDRVHEPQGRREGLDHAPPGRAAARPAAGQDRGFDRRQGHGRARGHGRHVPAPPREPRVARGRGRRVPRVVARAAAVSTPSARALLEGLVDYAGLFPPTALSMDEAVAEYARWRRSPPSFMLGRFVLPAARLRDFSRAADAHLPEAGGGEPWRLSALVGADVHGDSSLVTSFNRSLAGRAVVDAVELKAAGPQDADTSLEALPPGLTAFVEVPLGGDLGGLLAALRRRGARAKARTGGVVPDAIPDPADLARFVAACAAGQVPWKATAGLHHPVRAEQALTYEPGGPRALLHGFLNVFAAAAFAAGGASVADLEAVLREEDEAAFRLDDDGLSWRHLRASTDELARSRREAASSFGSCSFAEPVADLRSLGILP